MRLTDLLARYFNGSAAFRTELRAWMRENGYWYATSGVVHGILAMLVVLGVSFLPDVMPDRAPPAAEEPPLLLRADEVEVPEIPKESRFEVGEAPLEPSKLTAETLAQLDAPGQKAVHYDDSGEFKAAGGGGNSDRAGLMVGGMGGLSIKDLTGPGGNGGIGASRGTGNGPGVGDGDGGGFGSRGSGSRKAIVGSSGGTMATERAVGAALNWLYRHQQPAGNWSIQHVRQCAGGTCSGPGTEKSDSAATALGLLPFFAAGQTHKGKGPYHQSIQKAIAWLIKHQDSSGDLSAGCPKRMYAHGLAAIALCEAYGMTKDDYVGAAATRAVRFIEQAQHPTTGGWRYEPGQEGDTSVTGWQVMALKSAQMAGLGVSGYSLEQSRKWLQYVSTGENNGLYTYMHYREVTPSMTAVGTLCYQYLGARRDDSSLVEGREYLLAHLPDTGSDRNTYYWYYGTMAMHNFMGPEWDIWNRRMRHALITTQEKEGCATGSWAPEKDTWGPQGGRLMTTALATLTLEVYYRHLPLFQMSLPAMPSEQPKTSNLAKDKTPPKQEARRNAPVLP